MVNQKPFFEVSNFISCHEQLTLSSSEEINSGHLGNNISFFDKY